jgi:hypothetical protein
MHVFVVVLGVRFPQGLKSLSAALETPWLLYVPFWCDKRHLFLSFPYVCPEPVLAK